MSRHDYISSRKEFRSPSCRHSRFKSAIRRPMQSTSNLSSTRVMLSKPADLEPGVHDAWNSCPGPGSRTWGSHAQWAPSGQRDQLQPEYAFPCTWQTKPRTTANSTSHRATLCSLANRLQTPPRAWQTARANFGGQSSSVAQLGTGCGRHLSSGGRGPSAERRVLSSNSA